MGLYVTGKRCLWCHREAGLSVGIGGALLNRHIQCFKGLTQVNHIVRSEILHSHSDLKGHDTYLMDYFSRGSGLHRYGCKGGYTREMLKSRDIFLFKK